MIDQQDRVALVGAVTKAVKAMGPVPAFDVEVEGQEGGVARAKVSDKAGHVTPLYAYAVRRAGQWSVVEMGTFFEPEFYAKHKIPAALHLK